MLDFCGAHHLSRVVFSELFCRVHFGIKYEDLKQTADIWQVQYENETTKELTSNGCII